MLRNSTKLMVLSTLFQMIRKSLISLNASQRLSSTLSPKINPVQEKLLEERCILVDENDREIGSDSKRNCHTLDDRGQSPLHRAFSLFIFNEKNELLMQQRSDEKITFPGLWTNTCCSHPLAVSEEQDLNNEAIGVRRAAQRRVLNELGILPEHCPTEEMVFLTRILYSAPSQCGQWGENELDYILFLKTKALKFEPNPNEVKAVTFLKANQLDEFIRERAKLTPWFSLLARSFLPKWWANLENIEQYKDHASIHKFPFEG